MHKKLMMACMAIAAFAAFVVAPSASAASLNEGAATVPVGASITGQNVAGTETVFTAGELTVRCTKAHIPGTVTANSNGTVAGEILAGKPVFTGTGAGEDCTSPLGDTKPTVNSKLCLHVAKGTDAGTVTGCAGASVTFSLNVTPLGITCTYSAASIGGTITTAPNAAAVNLVKAGPALKDTGGFLCPAEGTLDMEFVLTTTGGGALTFS
ncbi:MAG TPA: hypothetical protein VFP21_04665 [Solirubrobacterales bacterium]|nr:hypothetical protein [Solirubrobacterales bacterium]